LLGFAEAHKAVPNATTTKNAAAAIKLPASESVALAGSEKITPKAAISAPASADVIVRKVMRRRVIGLDLRR
jgi:hypothetical protein